MVSKSAIYIFSEGMGFLSRMLMPARGKGFQNRIHGRKVFSRPRGIEPAWDEVSGINQTVHGYIGRMQVLGEDGFQICNIYFFGGYRVFEPNAHAHKGQRFSK